MNKLITTANINDNDSIYEQLINAHSGLTDNASEEFNARLILILINHIGDAEIINDALLAASSTRHDA